MGYAEKTGISFFFYTLEIALPISPRYAFLVCLVVLLVATRNIQ
jgi:hypothetical protein